MYLQALCGGALGSITLDKLLMFLQLEEKRKKAKSEGRSVIEEDDPDKVGATVCAVCLVSRTSH